MIALNMHPTGTGDRCAHMALPQITTAMRAIGGGGGFRGQNAGRAVRQGRFYVKNEASSA